MKLECNHIVVNRNGSVGAVACIVGVPHLIVFSSFTMKASQINEEGQAKNTNYDIVKVYDGSNVENPNDIFKKSFKVEELPLVWEETNGNS